MNSYGIFKMGALADAPSGTVGTGSASEIGLTLIDNVSAGYDTIRGSFALMPELKWIAGLLVVGGAYWYYKSRK